MSLMPDHKKTPGQIPGFQIYRLLPAAWIVCGGVLWGLWQPSGNQLNLPAIVLWLFGCVATTWLCRNFDKRIRQHQETTQLLRQELTEQSECVAQQTARMTEENRQWQNNLADCAAKKSVLKNELHEVEKILHEAGTAICVIDNAYTILRANNAMADIFNRSRHELIGNKCFHVLQSPFCGTSRCPVQCICSRQTKYIEYRFEPLCQGGNNRILAITATPFTDNDGHTRGIIKTIRQTSTNDTPKRTILARRTHDLNNALAAIIGHTELALQQAITGTLLHDNLSKALTAAERSQNLVAQLSAPANDTEQKTTPLSLSAILIEAAAQLTEKLPRNIILKKRNMPGHGMVLADQAQLHESIINLSLQAASAMGENGGTLELALGLFSLTKKSLSLDLPPGEYFLLRITATPPEAREPTVDLSQSTSTPAMAMAKNVVKRIGGTIDIETTATNIYLPALHGQQSTTGHLRKRQPIAGGREKILFVDDEEVLVSMTKQFMDELGYQFDGETSSMTALDRFKKSPAYYDLVITDQTMPQLTGIQMAESMLAIRPDLPIILYSGYSENVDKAQAKEIGIKIFLMKPVSASELSQTIRTLLDATQTNITLPVPPEKKH